MKNNNADEENAAITKRAMIKVIRILTLNRRQARVILIYITILFLLLLSTQVYILIVLWRAGLLPGGG